MRERRGGQSRGSHMETTSPPRATRDREASHITQAKQCRNRANAQRHRFAKKRHDYDQVEMARVLELTNRMLKTDQNTLKQELRSLVEVGARIAATSNDPTCTLQTFLTKWARLPWETWQEYPIYHDGYLNSNAFSLAVHRGLGPRLRTTLPEYNKVVSDLALLEGNRQACSSNKSSKRPGHLLNAQVVWQTSQSPESLYHSSTTQLPSNSFVQDQMISVITPTALDVETHATSQALAHTSNTSPMYWDWNNPKPIAVSREISYDMTSMYLPGGSCSSIPYFDQESVGIFHDEILNRPNVSLTGFNSTLIGEVFYYTGQANVVDGCYEGYVQGQSQRAMYNPLATDVKECDTTLHQWDSVSELYDYHSNSSDYRAATDTRDAARGVNPGTSTVLLHHWIQPLGGVIYEWNS